MKLRKNRWRNKVLWGSLAGLLYKLLSDLGFNIAPEHFQSYVDIVLFILLTLGIINDPNEGDGLSDDY